MWQHFTAACVAALHACRTKGLWFKPWSAEFCLLSCSWWGICCLHFQIIKIPTASSFNSFWQPDCFSTRKRTSSFCVPRVSAKRCEAVELRPNVEKTGETFFFFLPKFIVQKDSELWSRFLCMRVTHRRSNLCRVRVCVFVCAYVHYPKAVKQGEGWASGEQSRLSGLLH